MNHAENRERRTRLYIVRHGQTFWNSEHRIQGKLDSPLTDLGFLQAQWLRDRLCQVPFDLVVSSSSPRARTTANILHEGRDCNVRASDSFMEMSLGEWEGMMRREAEALYPSQMHLYWNVPSQFVPVGDGETFEDVRRRVIPELERMILENRGSIILLVAHTVVIKIIMAHFDRRPPDSLWNPPHINHASLSIVNIHGSDSSIEAYGDTSHYRDR